MKMEEIEKELSKYIILYYTIFNDMKSLPKQNLEEITFLGTHLDFIAAKIKQLTKSVSSQRVDTILKEYFHE